MNGMLGLMYEQKGMEDRERQFAIEQAEFVAKEDLRFEIELSVLLLC